MSRCFKIKKKKEKEEILLPPLTENQSLSVQDIKIESKKTTPPSRYTEATLLEAMEKCQIEDDKELTDILKSVKGIGRSSTRANIIETIIRSGFIQREKNHLVATEKAHKLMSILPPILTSAKMTAEWEEKLDQIERGELSATQFMYEIESFVRNVVDQEKSTVATFQFENNRPQKKKSVSVRNVKVQCMRVIKTFIVQIENVHLLYGKRIDSLKVKERN